MSKPMEPFLAEVVHRMKENGASATHRAIIINTLFAPQFLPVVSQEPVRCLVCGWTSGRRPDTCYGDGEHVFVSVATSEPQAEPPHPPYGRPSIDMARHLPAEAAREVYEAIIAERGEVIDEMQRTMDRLAERVAEPMCGEAQAACPPAAEAQPFTVEEARRRASSHEAQASDLRVEAESGHVSLERIATEHERTAATLRAYEAQEGRIADLERLAADRDEAMRKASIAISELESRLTAIRESRDLLEDALRGKGAELFNLRARFATVRAEAQALRKFAMMRAGWGGRVEPQGIVAAMTVILAACDGAGGEVAVTHTQAEKMAADCDKCGKQLSPGAIARYSHEKGLVIEGYCNCEAAELRRKLARAEAEFTHAIAGVRDGWTTLHISDHLKRALAAIGEGGK